MMGGFSRATSPSGGSAVQPAETTHHTTPCAQTCCHTPTGAQLAVGIRFGNRCVAAHANVAPATRLEADDVDLGVGDDCKNAGERVDVAVGKLGHQGQVTCYNKTQTSLEQMPTEVLLHVLGYLDVCDLLATSRANHLLRDLSISPILHQYRLRHTRAVIPPLLTSPSRPSLADLIARSIFLTRTTVVSRRLARSLVSIRLARRLAARPSPEALVQRAVLPQECVPGMASPVHVAPALVAKRRAIEKERVKDGLNRWITGKWRSEVRVREEGVRKYEERSGVGRVWRLRKYWESLGRGQPGPV